jgi:sulfhydrogenase subunit alpha
MPTTDVAIDVHHLTRVEGHGNIVVNVKDGCIETCEWQVPEAPRFFEAMIVGRHYSEVSRIVSRICGICAVGHTLASVKASEAALGITVSRQTELLRQILKHGENFDSHVLHVYFLVAPDLVGAPSVFPLVPTHTDVVLRALRMKRVGCDWASLIGGRSTHPTKVVVGGFASLPGAAYNVKQAEQELRDLKTKITSMLPDAIETYNLLLELAGEIPAFERPTEYVALHHPDEYGLYDGDIACLMPDGSKQIIPVRDYKSVCNEYVVKQSTAKHCKHNMDSYMAGALARININFSQLHPEAKAIAAGFNFKPPCFNPYMNTVAQFIECVHSAHAAIEAIDELLETGIKDEKPVTPSRFGRGAGAVEVPRGILFHEYEYDLDGMCTGGNCVIPTGQNHGNIQKDFEALVPEMLGSDKSEDEIRLGLEMLVRAYDPCISCSTHYLDVTFKNG